MIECIFTLDYEIYGNGEGFLKELVYDPAERLRTIFRNWGCPMVVFVEVGELEMIEAQGSDPAIEMVKRQVQELHEEAHEIALHLHPQWYNSRYEDGKWSLDYSEYNLCTLPRERIVLIVERSIAYLQNIVGVADYSPVSFRAGNWLFQPTRHAAIVIAERGIKVDSSVFKGGVQREHRLDYRRAAKNGYYWKFQDDINTSDNRGVLLEIPIYTHMLPFWKMVTKKRIGLQQKGSSSITTAKQRLYRLQDIAHFWYPLKFDFCRMTTDELARMVDRVIEEDQRDPASFKPLVAIGHTKDLVDFETVELLLAYLAKRGIAISTFEKVYDRCLLDELNG